jgi:hypothetical protein
MWSEHDRMAPYRAALLAILADYTAWLDKDGIVGADRAVYADRAARYLDEMDPQLAPAPSPAMVRCDLCTRPFQWTSKLGPERWTGNHFLWCTDCAAHQATLRAQMGDEAYRRYWAIELTEGKR